MLLAGDIGATKTNLAVFSEERGPRDPLFEGTFPSDRYPSLQALVRVTATNLPWSMDETELREALDLESVNLINDLDAIAHSVPFLEPSDLHVVNQGDPVPGGALAIIAPGTGLGEGFLVWDGTQYIPSPSEGGHASFAPTNALQIELLRHLLKQHHHVSFERVCSGLGIPNIYAFLKETVRGPEPDWLAAQLATANDPTPVIVNTALADKSDLCRITLETFVSILGAEAGNLALKVLATGGVYLGGGIPPRILPTLTDGRFMEAFANKGRFRNLLSSMPVYVILSPKSALLGAACHGLGLKPI